MSRRWAYAAAALPLLAAASGPHKVVRNAGGLEFSYVWPAEAVAIPALDLKLYTDAKANLAKAQKYASEDERLRTSKSSDFGHYYSMTWSSAGQSSRLLSLEGTFETYTGGAHPAHGSEALLWDRRLNRAIDVAALFVKSSSFPAGCLLQGARRGTSAAPRGREAGRRFRRLPEIKRAQDRPVRQ